MSPLSLIGLLMAAAPLAAAPAWRVSPATGGTLELRQGEARATVIKPTTPPGARGPAAVREVTVAGERLIEVRMPLRGTRSVPPANAAEVWLGQVKGDTVVALWTGRTGPEDADGEASRELSVGPADVVLYETAAGVSRCDGKTPRLFQRRLDLATGRWADLVPDTQAAGERLVARRAGAPSGRPRIDFAFSAASAPPADAHQASPRALVAPLAVNDGAPETVWAERGPAGGRGSWLTARTATSARVTGVRVVPGDARSRGQYLARGRASAVALVFGPAPGQRFEVTLDEAGSPGNPRTPFWIPLPRPVDSDCLTVEVTDVVPGQGHDGEVLAWTDIDVFSDVDGADGLSRLAAQLGTPDCERRVADVVAAGAAALPDVTAALARATSANRGCALAAVTGLLAGHTPPAPALANALVTALRGATPGEERTIGDLLEPAGDAPVPALIATLHDGALGLDDRMRAVRVLTRLDRAGARAALLAAVGDGPPPLREALRQIGGAPGGPSASETRAAFAATPQTATARRADLIRLLGLARARGQADAANEETLALLSTAALDTREPFEVRGRAVSALEAIAVPAAFEALTAVRAHAQDAPLRRLAVQALASRRDASVLDALRAALADADPRVREIAALALGQHRDTGATALLTGAAKQEPWPAVRRAEIVALSQACGSGVGDLFLRAVERDVPDVRRAALVGLVTCRDPRAARVLLERLRNSDEITPVRTQAAIQLGRLHEPGLGTNLAAALKDLQTESQTDPILEETTVATLASLTSTGGPEATRAALETCGDPRPVLRRAAIEALGRLCGPQADGRIREATRDPAEAVAAAARSALRSCAGTRPPTRSGP